MRIMISAVLILIACIGGASADSYCSAPLSDWQPREIFQKKLESEGWQNIAIRIEDGCYLVRASNERGERLHGKFDPATLAPVPGGRRHHEDEGERRHSSDE